MLHARTPVGQISDFLRAYPNITYDQYMYKMSVAMITLMGMDFTHEVTLNEAQYQFYKTECMEAPDYEDFMNAFQR